MKLTRRVLAVIVAVAMLVGVMATGAFAAVGDYDATSNPYTTKIGLKAYRADESGEYVEITDGKVLDGEVIRVEVWGQTNYYASIANFITAYSNGLFAPTKLDGSTYDYDATSAVGLGAEVIEQIAYDDEATALADEAVANNGYAGFDTPYEYNAAAALTTSFAGANDAAAIANMYPAAWKDGSAVNATGAAYNVLSAGFGPDMNMDYPATINDSYSKAVVIDEYQAIFCFYLTVDATAGTKGVVTLPEAAVRSSSNISGRMYVSAGTPNANFDDFGYPLYEAQAIPVAAFNFSQYKDTYEDDTVADRVVDLSEGTINFTVVTSLDGGDEPIVPEVNKDALDAAIKTLPAFTEDEAEATSWADYEAALAEAQAVYADPDATQDDVNAAEEALLAAIAAVVAKPAVAPELVVADGATTVIDVENGFIYGLIDGDSEYGEIDESNISDWLAVEGEGEIEIIGVDGYSNIGTGAEINLLDADGNVVESYKAVIFGDYDGDGYITDFDLIDFGFHCAWMMEDCQTDYFDMTNPQAFAMDVDASGEPDEFDLTIIQFAAAWVENTIDQTYGA